MKRLFQAIGIAVSLSCIIAEIPNYIQKCQVDDGQCITKNINTIFTNKFKGDKEFGLDRLDVIDVPIIDVLEDPKNPVRINVTFTNMIIYGGENLRAEKVKGFGKNPEGRFHVLLKSSAMVLSSDYKVNGKVLILPIKGEGKSNFTIINPQIKITFRGDAQTRHGKVYLNVKNTNIEMICDQLLMHFDNLFDGDKALGANMNTFINENWKEIYGQMKAPIFEGFSHRAHEMVKSVFDKTPYAELIGN